MPTADSNAPDWIPYLEQARGDLPLDFLVRWKDRESAGNPCSVGSVTQLRSAGWAREAGIGQLYFESRDQTVFGVTLAQLRGACSATDQTLLRPLTDDECIAQAESLCAMAQSYLALSKSRLSNAGVVWTDAEMLCLCKLQHGLPALGRSFLPAAAQAGRAGSWADFRAYVDELNAAQVTAIDRGATPYMPFDRIFDNAQYTGGL